MSDRTKQGVRNLNGPKLDGKYNGRTCSHYQTEHKHELRASTYQSGGKTKESVRSVKVERCLACGAEVNAVIDTTTYVEFAEGRQQEGGA